MTGRKRIPPPPSNPDWRTPVRDVVVIPDDQPTELPAADETPEKIIDVHADLPEGSMWRNGLPGKSKGW